MKKLKKTQTQVWDETIRAKNKFSWEHNFKTFLTAIPNRKGPSVYIYYPTAKFCLRLNWYFKSSKKKEKIAGKSKLDS